MKKISFRAALNWSLFLHLILLLLVSFSFFVRPTVKTPPKTKLNLSQAQQVKIVHAVSVSQAEVEQAIEQLKTQQAQKQTEAQAQLATIKKEANQAAQLKQEQSKALAKLQAQQKAINDQLKKQQQAAQQKLDEIKQQTAQANKNLATTQKTNEQASKQLAATQAKVKAQKQALDDAQKDLQKQAQAESTQLEQAEQQKVNSELAKYTELIRQAISQQWIIPSNTDPNMYCILEIKLSSNGVVNSVQVVQSSGNSALDRSAVTAVYKASPVPVPSDANTFKLMQDIQLKVQPKNL